MTRFPIPFIATAHKGAITVRHTVRIVSGARAANPGDTVARPSAINCHKGPTAVRHALPLIVEADSVAASPDVAWGVRVGACR